MMWKSGRREKTASSLSWLACCFLIISVPISPNAPVSRQDQGSGISVAFCIEDIAGQSIIYLLATLRLQLAKHWKTAYAPYRKRIDETSRELGYKELWHE